MNNYLIDQSPSKALVRFSIPMIIARFFQQIYTIVDSAVVGKFVGEKALASIGASFALTTIFICIAIGGGVGASVVISRYFGKKDYPRMKLAIYTAIFSFLILSILLSLFSLIFSKEILVILNTPE
ncbi:MAG: MATE family efflux transporter, partial [Anaerococcus sp.]|nr:MATE family efflux transporter [Anaerococcus sp.]